MANSKGCADDAHYKVVNDDDGGDLMKMTRTSGGAISIKNK